MPVIWCCLDRGARRRLPDGCVVNTLHNCLPHTIVAMANNGVSAVKGCWAACLGDCEGGISGEHYVSQCLFTDSMLTVQGFHWCKDAPRTVGIASLTNKMLCREHNSRLSELDSAMLKATQVFCEAQDLIESRKAYRNRHWNIKEFRLDGPLMERWFLKTLINVSYEGDKFIGIDSPQLGAPSKELVEVVFGLRKFDQFGGMHTLAEVGENIQVQEHIRVRSQIHEQTIVL